MEVVAGKNIDFIVKIDDVGPLFAHIMGKVGMKDIPRQTIAPGRTAEFLFETARLLGMGKLVGQGQAVIG